MMILVGQLDSPFVRRVAATLSYYGLAFDRHVLSVFSDADEVKRLNPLGKVPALIIDEGETLIDSAMIIDYLDDLVGPDRALTPKSGPGRRAVLRLATLFMGISDRAVQLRVETVRRPQHLQHPEFIDAYGRALRASLDFLERDCATPWAVDPRLVKGPTQADFAATAALTHLSAKVPEFENLDTWPKLAALRAAGEALDAFRDNPFSEG